MSDIELVFTVLAATMAYLWLGIAALAWLRPDLVEETVAALTNMLTWPLGIPAQVLWFRRPWYRRWRKWREGRRK